LARLRSCVERLAGSVPVAVALPTLPIAPIEISAAAQALNVETSLWAAVWNFAEWCVSKHRVRLLSMAEIDRVSPQTERFDLRSEISFGSPGRGPLARPEPAAGNCYGNASGQTPSRETFLSALEARISFQLSRDAQDQRAFELVNKTNQFNLNGRRITETGWRQTLENPEGFL